MLYFHRMHGEVPWQMLGTRTSPRRNPIADAPMASLGKPTCDILVGAVWADLELADISHGVAHVCPTYAVAIAPWDFREPTNVAIPWKEVSMVDSDFYGSAHNQRWRLYIWGNLTSGHMHLENQYGQSQLIADAYRNVGLTPKKDGLGVTRIIPPDHATGLTATVDNTDGERYSASSHVPQLKMSEIWSGEPAWPECVEYQDGVTSQEKS